MLNIIIIIHLTIVLNITLQNEILFQRIHLMFRQGGGHDEISIKKVSHGLHDAKNIKKYHK